MGGRGIMITPFERFQDVLGPQGKSSIRFASFIEEITRQVNNSTVLSGSGSPEGVVTASAPKFYVDSDTGDYYKKTGNGSSGWVLI